MAIIALATALVAGCSGSGSQSAAERLQASVDANWGQYAQDHGLPGGGMSTLSRAKRFGRISGNESFPRFGLSDRREGRDCVSGILQATKIGGSRRY
ncbi:MAG: hypothetical protein D4R80_06510 [Deltaproteobacteria bacterium]|nr:MAG: hypothetical protein D4R80_06510 [Deltaproteobacteria bacterium]